MRTYKEIFEKDKQKLIEDSIEKSKEIARLLPNLRIHSQEHIHCLNAGSSLGSLLIAFAMVECLVLCLYTVCMQSDRAKVDAVKGLGDYEHDIIHFNKALDELTSRNWISATDLDKLKGCYKDYRIPLIHGLLSKGSFVESFTHQLSILLLQSDEKPSIRTPASWQTIEETLDEFPAIENYILTTVLKIARRLED